jgi:hypothetical protein
MTNFTPSDIVCAFKEKTNILGNFSDQIIELHHLASNIEDYDIAMKVRMLADQLATIGNEYNEKNSS